MTRFPRVAAVTGLLLGAALRTPVANAAFVNFETQHVHPIALNQAGDQLAAVNTPDARVSFFRVDAAGMLTLDFEVQVGLEPVSVARTRQARPKQIRMAESFFIVSAREYPS